MSYAQLIFSPTGGTKKVSDAVTEKWGTDLETVDLTDVTGAFSEKEFQKGDLVLIAVPSYGGRVPELAARRLGQVRGNGADCVLLCVYGNRAYEDTLLELGDIAEECGFKVLAGIAAVAEHSIMRQYAAGRPDRQDVEALHGYSERILEKFKAESGEATKPVSLPGNSPYKKAAGLPLVPKAGKACTGCGLCAQRCPAGAISRDNLKTADSKKCIACMRCVTDCPQSARGVSKVMTSTAALALKKACSVRKDCELFI